MLSDGCADHLIDAGGRVLARRDRSGTGTSVHEDAAGSVRRTTDASGAVTSAIDYDALGARRAQSGTPLLLGYRGGVTAPGSKLVTIGQRQYDPESGTYLTENLIAFGQCFADVTSAVAGDCPGGGGGAPGGLDPVLAAGVAGAGAVVGAALGSRNEGSGSSGGSPDIRTRPATPVIGKTFETENPENLGPGEWTLDEYLPEIRNEAGELDVPALREQNENVIDELIRRGGPIRDLHVNPDGTLQEDPNPESFLNLERDRLRNAGWDFDPATGKWGPP